jgi:hypothetical protein
MKLDTASVGWTAGQYLDVEMQPEVTVASGTGGDVAAVALRHDAGGAEPLLMEIDV